MKEVKVATLTKEDIKELKDVEKLEEKAYTVQFQYRAAREIFWGLLKGKYNLPSTDYSHYIKGNSIYRQEIQ